MKSLWRLPLLITGLTFYFLFCFVFLKEWYFSCQFQFLSSTHLLLLTFQPITSCVPLRFKAIRCQAMFKKNNKTAAKILVICNAALQGNLLVSLDSFLPVNNLYRTRSSDAAWNIRGKRSVLWLSLGRMTFQSLAHYLYARVFLHKENMSAVDHCFVYMFCSYASALPLKNIPTLKTFMHFVIWNILDQLNIAHQN